MDVDELLEIVKADSMSNVTFSGGDPFYQVEAFTELARRIKEETAKTIWCWTGFTLEEIQASEQLSQMLPWLDVLVVALHPGAAGHGSAVPRQSQPAHHLPPRRPARRLHPRHRSPGKAKISPE